MKITLLGLLITTFTCCLVSDAQTVVTVDGQQVSTDDGLSNGSGTTQSQYSYTGPYTVTIENVSSSSLSRVFSTMDRQVTRLKRSLCPSRATLIVQSFEASGGSIYSDNPTLNGNQNVFVNANTNNFFGSNDGTIAVAVAGGTNSNNSSNISNSSSRVNVLGSARMSVLCRVRNSTSSSSQRRTR